MKRWIASLLACALFSLAQPDFKVTLIHTNDLHAHLEPVKVKGIELGGYARLATVIKNIKSTSEHPVLLNAGDTFQGTLFFNVYHGLADVAIMNTMGYDAACTGNHEFDLGPKVLADFIKLANFPVLAANLDVSKDPNLRDQIGRFKIIEFGEEEKVGIVGAVTPDLASISSPGDLVKIKPLVESVQAAIDQVIAFDCDHVIVLSHCGYEVEKELASKLHGVDVIVGGHSHSLLGDTSLPEGVKSVGPYPTVTKNADGDTVLIVQAWEWGKVLGKLEVTFDEKGRVESWSKGQPIAMNVSVSDDPIVKSIISAFKKPIEELMNKPVGETKIEIPRNGPTKQGLMADLITDSMLAATAKMGSVVAFMNAGGVRSGLNAGVITYGDAISVQPFNNTLVTIELKGEEIKAALASGILYVSKGSRFKLVGGNSATDIVIAEKPLDLNATYKCTFNSFVANGGDGLTVIKDAKGARQDTGILDIDAFLEFIKSQTPLEPKGQARISGS